MRPYTPIVLGPTITLRRHPMAAIPPIMFRACIGIFLSVLGIAHGSPILLVAGILAGGVMTIHGVHAWSVYRVSIRYDRILVRQLRWGHIQQNLYPNPGLRGLMCRQSILGQALDVGTLHLLLPDHTIRLTMLTPYSAMDTALGFDS